MAELAWDGKYAVGVGEIDDDHKELFALVGELESAVAGNEPAVAARNEEMADVGALLRKLADAAGKHFSSEEATMRALKYPGLALYVANHQRLAEKIEAFVTRYGRSGVVFDRHALNFLRDWLLFHIENDDLRLGAWLQDRARELGRAEKQKPALAQGA